jgi:hypothetical protein
MASTVFVRGEEYDLAGLPAGDVDALSRDYLASQEEKGVTLDAGTVYTVRAAFWRAAGLFGEPGTIAGGDPSAGQPGILQTLSDNLGASLSTVGDVLKRTAAAAPAALASVEGTTKAAAIIVVALVALYMLGPATRGLGKRIK